MIVAFRPVPVKFVGRLKHLCGLSLPALRVKSDWHDAGTHKARQSVKGREQCVCVCAERGGTRCLSARRSDAKVLNALAI